MYNFKPRDDVLTWSRGQPDLRSVCYTPNHNNLLLSCDNDNNIISLTCHRTHRVVLLWGATVQSDHEHSRTISCTVLLPTYIIVHRTQFTAKKCCIDYYFMRNSRAIIVTPTTVPHAHNNRRTLFFI